MYPQVTQFATRERLLGEELQLLEERRSAAKRQGQQKAWRRLLSGERRVFARTPA